MGSFANINPYENFRMYSIWALLWEKLILLHTKNKGIYPHRVAAIKNVNIDQHRSKIVRNRVFHCHLSLDWRQMAIENTVSIDFLYAFVDF